MTKLQSVFCVAVLCLTFCSGAATTFAADEQKQSSSRYGKLIANGNKLFEKRDYNLALDNFNEAIQENPEDENAYIGRGKVYIEKQEYNLALADFNEVIRQNPDSVEGYIGRGRVYVHTEKNFDKAIYDFDKALRLDPKSEVVKFLIEKSADFNAKTENGETILHRAAKWGSLEVVKYLIEKGLDVNEKDLWGCTVLHSAADSWHENLELVKCLVDKGADVNAEDKEGKTPLDKCLFKEVRKILREAGGKSGAEIE